MDARALSKSFAIEVVAKLGGHVREVKGPGTIGFCMALIANLGEAEKWLESNPDQKRVLELLDCLNGLIHTLSNWRLGYTPIPRSRQASQPFHRKQFPGLCDLVDDKPWGRDNFIRFVKTHRELNSRAEFLKVLASFKAPASVDIRLDPLDSAEPVKMQDSKAHKNITPIHTLYSCLSEIHCAGSDTKITANLRLRADGKYGIDSAGSTFRIFFLDHPHEVLARSSDLCRWQDTMISVFGKQVEFEEKQNFKVEKPSQSVSPAEFCEVIKQSSSQIQIRLELTDKGLILREPKPSSFQGRMLRSSACICLAEILDLKTQLRKKMKLLLSYYLARAFWHFYSSGWMEKSWTKECIYFMFDPKSTMPTGISMNEPYLSVLHPITRNSDIEISSSSYQFRMHQFPNILALGILLMEIELGQKIENYDAKCYNTDGQLDINTSYLIAHHIFKEKPVLWEQNDTFPVVRRIIGICFGLKPNGEPLDRDPFLDFHDGKDVSMLRDAIYQSVVSRLQEQCMNTWWGSESDPDAWAAPLYPIWGNSTFHQLSAHDHDILGSRSERGAASPSNISSSEWFKKLDANMISALRIKDNDRDAHASRVKIAILDTGIDSKFTEPIRKARRIEKYFDFIDYNNTSPQDNTGHGTNIFQLMHKVCDAAEFYIGRVWEDGRMNERTPHLMEKAIDYARKEWDVDIIVLSSGFEEHYDNIERAIEDSNRARILTFAAASNYGNFTGISFPGRLYGHGKVLCIFSTNAMARSSSQHTFNPSPLPKAHHRSFAILGEDITLEDVNEPLCGTSFSTAVGAAIAARILDFSRHPDSRSVIERPADLKKVEGMLAVFGQMSIPDNSYQCMSPWTICKIRSIEGEDRVQTRQRQREEACDRIKEALRRINLA